jgi:membrane protein YqaA with SNARE-associated domain
MYKEKVPSPRPWLNERLFRAIVIALVLTFILIIWLLRGRLPDSSTVGYLGVFILSFVSSASVVIPLPGIAAVCAGASLGALFPLGVGLLAAVAEALGELTGYLIGFSGRREVENHRFYPRIERWMQRRGWLVLFLASSIPNPMFDLVGIAAGTLRYPVWRFLAAVWAGKLIKSTTIAYACFFGVESAFGLFGSN